MIAITVPTHTLYDLANDLNRVFIERLNKDLIISLTPENLRSKNKNIGSIKALEHLLNALGHPGRRVTQHLVGTYELRHSASHLPSSDIQEIYKLASLDEANPKQRNAEILIGAYANVIGFLSNVIRRDL